MFPPAGYFAGCSSSWREIECPRLIGDMNVRCEDIANASRCYDLALKLAEEIGSEVERLSRDRINALLRHERQALSSRFTPQ